MENKFVISFMLNLLLLAEIILPIALIIILGFFAWRLIRKKWVHRMFSKLVYKKNPFVSDFYEQVGHSVEVKGSRVMKPVSYIALILCVALIFKILWPYIFHPGRSANSFLEGGLPLTFLYMGLVFVGLGVSASVISSLLFIKETKKFDVYNRSIEIYLLSKYFEDILHITLGIALLVGTVYLWFFVLDLSVPVFTYLEDKIASVGEPRVNFGEMLKLWRILIISFRDEFQTWCITSFLISLASLTIPYLWFKGRRFTKIFLALFFSGTVFSYCVSFLIKKFIISQLSWIFLSVWIFSALITTMVFHLINTVWLNKICICRRCQAENSLRAKYCIECGHKLILLPKESRAWF
jgi:ribosomal protein L40E